MVRFRCECIVLDWADVPGAVLYQFYGETVNGNIQLNRTTANSGFSIPAHVPNNFSVRVQLRAQDASGTWSNWTPLTFYIVSDAACATCAMVIPAMPIGSSTSHNTEMVFPADKMGQNIFRIFPNPAHEMLNIVSSFSAGYQLDIVDIYGQILKREQAMDRTHVVMDIRDLQAGIYFVRIQQGNSFLVKRFSKL